MSFKGCIYALSIDSIPNSCINQINLLIKINIDRPGIGNSDTNNIASLADKIAANNSLIVNIFVFLL